VLAGDEREALLEALDRLSRELGYVGAEELPAPEPRLGGDARGTRILSPEDERLVQKLRSGLARVALALAGPETDEAVRAALDGAELVMRGELQKGTAARLPELMPDFVFLLALALVGQERALQLSIRTRDLVEGTLR
jgi:hypothetical protein